MKQIHTKLRTLQENKPNSFIHANNRISFIHAIIKGEKKERKIDWDTEVVEGREGGGRERQSSMHEIPPLLEMSWANLLPPPRLPSSPSLFPIIKTKYLTSSSFTDSHRTLDKSVCVCVCVCIEFVRPRKELLLFLRGREMYKKSLNVNYI